jgi:hypothetical protein
VPSPVSNSEPVRGESDARLLTRADENYRELLRALARIAPNGAIAEDDELLLAYSGPRLPMLNAAVVKRVPENQEAAWKRAAAFFGARDQGWAYITRDDVTTALGPALRAQRRGEHVSPGMVLYPLHGSEPTVPGLVIEAVSTNARLRIYNDTMTAGFDSEWANGEVLDSNALLDVLGVVHYVGWIEGEPVGTAMRLSSHGSAGVFNVSTVPAFRRRGIGEALTWRAALDGREEGCLASSLQASEMGEPVYRRMGYRDVCSYTVWTPSV